MNAHIPTPTEKEITFAGNKVVLRELTVAQVRKVLKSVETAEQNLLDELLDGFIPAEAIIESSGIPLKTLEKHSPSDLETLAKEVGQINPFFEGMIRRKIKAFEEIKQRLMEKEGPLPASLTETPAS